MGRFKDVAKAFGWIVYFVGNIATFGHLTFFDGIVYNWWNWTILLPYNAFDAFIWPLYWGIVRPLGSGGTMYFAVALLVIASLVDKLRKRKKAAPTPRSE